jgi:hypothetical protein
MTSTAKKRTADPTVNHGLPSIIACCYLLKYVFQRVPHHGFYVVVLGCMYWFQTHLTKTSKYYTDGATRPWSHYLITSSLVYLVASLVALMYGQFHFSFLCLVTWCGSSLYHRHSEARYFNLDNIFATSLLVIFMWSMYLSYEYSTVYFNFGMIGIPVAGFLLVYCGMPADITTITNGAMCCYVREDRPLYNVVHACWHFASGVGPVASVLLFHQVSLSNGDLTLIMGVPASHCLDPWHWLPVVPALALLVGLCVNVCGNVAGIMPLD